MEKENARRKKVIAKFKKITTKNNTPFLAMGGGIFTPTTRKKVLGIMKQPEPGVSKNQFWEDRRNAVERALIDLRLFVEVAGRKNVNQVITRDSLKPIVEVLLWYPIVDRTEPNVNLAEIAQMLIEEGFGYLRGMFQFGSEHSISSSMQRTIADAIDGSKHLVFQVETLRKAAIERNERIAALAAEEVRTRQKLEGVEP